MRKIVNSTYISLDGVIEKPHLWPALGSSDERAAAIQAELLRSCDALLMGRRTYESFAGAWPSRSGDEVSDRINSMRKYVVSSTLRDPQWNNTVVIAGDLVAAIERLKSEPGGNVVQYGFGPVSFALLEQGLLDELRLWVHPLFVGSGGPDDLLFHRCPTTMLDLLATETLSNGIVILSYRFRKPSGRS